MNPALPFTLIRSGPSLSHEALTRVEASLAKHCDLAPLPQSYRQFLLANNGGCVSPGAVDSDSGEHEQAVVFDTPLVWTRDGNRPVSPELMFFFVAYREATTRDAEIDESLYWLVE